MCCPVIFFFCVIKMPYAYGFYITNTNSNALVSKYGNFIASRKIEVFKFIIFYIGKSGLIGPLP